MKGFVDILNKIRGFFGGNKQPEQTSAPQTQEDIDRAFKEKGLLKLTDPQTGEVTWSTPESARQQFPEGWSDPTQKGSQPANMQDLVSEAYGAKYRNPMVPGFLGSGGRALKPDEMVSGVNIASNEYGVPEDLLMDIAGLESQAGTWDRPFEKYSGQYADEKHARGPFMFLSGTAKGAGIDPYERYSATESARATARKLNKGQLGEWDVTDKPGAGGGRLTDWYSEEELDPYSFASLKRRSMLQRIAQGLGFSQ